MKGNRTVVLLILFVLLGGGTLWYLNSKPEEKTTLLGADREFAFEDTSRIHKIFLADREGETVTLERDGKYWTYNAQYRARPNAVENLLDAIRRVEVKYKPPQAAIPNMVRDLAAYGIKVELYDRRDQLLKSYYVGGGTADERGTHMIMEDAEQPYVCYLPSWEGNIRFRYNLKGEDWRDKTIFQDRPQEIAAISVEYPKQRSKSFRLERTAGGFKVRPFYATTPEINGRVNEGLVRTYLDGFRWIAAEAFETTNPLRDSILQLVPFSTITLKRTDGQEKTVRLFPIFLENEVLDPKYGLRTTTPNVPAERFFADVQHSGDFMLVQQRVFGKLLWAYPFFYETQ